MEETDKIAAFCKAIDEGDASPDVINFNDEAFIKEMKENWRHSKPFPSSVVDM